MIFVPFKYSYSIKSSSLTMYFHYSRCILS